MIINAEGIVLRQIKIANNKRMIVLFTKQYGKISAGTSISEKTRGKAALALRPFTYAEYDIFRGRESYSINSAQVISSFYSIGEDYARFEAASGLIEYLNKVIPDGEPMPKLFDMAIECMQSLSACKTDAETVLFAFIVKTLRMLGVAPELDCCVGCGKAAGSFGAGRKLFSVTGGGIICPECAEAEKREGDSLIYSPGFDIIDVFRYFDSKPLKTFEKVDLKPEVRKEVREIIAEYTDRYLGVDVLRSSIGLEV